MAEQKQKLKIFEIIIILILLVIVIWFFFFRGDSGQQSQFLSDVFSPDQEDVIQEPRGPEEVSDRELEAFEAANPPGVVEETGAGGVYTNATYSVSFSYQNPNIIDERYFFEPTPNTDIPNYRATVLEESNGAGLIQLEVFTTEQTLEEFATMYLAFNGETDPQFSQTDLAGLDAIDITAGGLYYVFAMRDAGEVIAVKELQDTSIINQFFSSLTL